MGFTIHQPWIEGGSLPLSAFSLSTQLHTYSKYSRSSYLSWMSLQTQLLGYPLFNKCARSSCFSWLSFIIVIFQSHLGASWLPGCTKILLMVRMRPAAIALNFSIKNIQNDIRQIIMKISIQLTSVGLAYARPIMYIYLWENQLSYIYMWQSYVDYSVTYLISSPLNFHTLMFSDTHVSMKCV